MGNEIYNSHIGYASQCFTAGYTQAVTDISAENEKLKFESQNYADLYRASLEVVNQYKEALRELVEDIEESKVYSTLAKIPMYKTLITPKIFDKAKQLITEQ